MFALLSQFLNLIYRKKCYFCGSSKDDTKMCDACYEKIEHIPVKILRHIYTVPVYCATIYEDNVQRLIRGIKYHNQKELAYYQAKIMYEYWQKLSVSEDKFVIVPVPLCKERQKKRKYNQMSLVAKEFAKMTGYEVNENIINRIRNTKPQYKLSKKEREKNLKNAFQCNKEFYNTDEKLLLMDDILTTGSTMEEMIKTLQKADVKNLAVFVTSCTKFNLI